MDSIHRSEPLSEQVYRYVRDSILSGQMHPGEKIVETKLAHLLQVSRSPVREAIRLLMNEQLVVDQDGALYVFQPTVHDLYDLYDLRLALEPMAARKAAENVYNRDREGQCLAHDAAFQHLSMLEQNIQRTLQSLESKNFSKLLVLNSEFHQTVWLMSDNTRFVRILEQASDLIQYYCLLVLNINNQQTNILREHIAVYEAIKEGDPIRAQEAMFDHIKKDMDVIQSQALLSLS